MQEKYTIHPIVSDRKNWDKVPTLKNFEVDMKKMAILVLNRGSSVDFRIEVE